MSEETGRHEPLTEDQSRFLSDYDLNREFLKLPSYARDHIIILIKADNDSKNESGQEIDVELPKGEWILHSRNEAGLSRDRLPNPPEGDDIPTFLRRKLD